MLPPSWRVSSPTRARSTSPLHGACSSTSTASAHGPSASSQTPLSPCTSTWTRAGNRSSHAAAHTTSSWAATSTGSLSCSVLSRSPAPKPSSLAACWLRQLLLVLAALSPRPTQMRCVSNSAVARALVPALASPAPPRPRGARSGTDPDVVRLQVSRRPGT